MNAQSKHTEGPWTSEATASSVFVTRAIRGPNDELIAHVGVPGYKDTPDVAQNVADARLIAAAPELLEALGSIAAWLVAPDLSTETLEHFRTKARAAIAKATQD